MKAVILAGGFGTRISEESSVKPKPMVEIGGKPIIWHIMKTYSHYGIKDFVICCGYKSHVLKEYFSNFSLYNNDVTFDFREDKTVFHNNNTEDWRVTLVETGLKTMTGGRLLKVKKYIDEDHFCFTYGDGLSDHNIKDSIDFHIDNKKLATVLAANLPGRFGALELNGNSVQSFTEKPKSEGSLINAGYFVLNKEIFKYIKDDETIWEKEPLQNLARDGELMAYNHNGFWKPMDTINDRNILESLWANDLAPWKVWKQID
tara:strand:+ start:743 stop:1522 length:780 start_codon:yes stop_codon:yes gene_type:complete